jgi:multidrug resistance protein, MATE family
MNYSRAVSKIEAIDRNAPRDGAGAAGATRRVLALAWPSILANLAPAALGATDTALMGRLGDPTGLGAIALGGSIFGILYWGFGFLRMATTGFTAQAYGAGDGDEVRAVLARAMMLGAGLGLALLALQTPLRDAALAAVQGSAAVEAQTRVYFDIVIWNAPAVLAIYAIAGWFIGLHAMRAAMAVNLWLIGANLVLDVWFVFGLGWGVEGVAVGTLVASWSAVGFGMFLVSRRLRRVGGRLTAGALFHRRRLARLFAVNRDIFVRTTVQMLAYAFFTAEAARLGDITLAANAVLGTFTMFVAQTLDGYALAIEAMVGGAIGRRDRGELNRLVRAATKLAVGTAALFSLAIWFGGEAVIAALSADEAVRRAALSYLPWAAVAPLVSVWCFMLDGVFIGATRAAEMRNGMLLAAAIYAVAWAVLTPLWGNHGLWLSLLIFMAARAAALAPFYPRVMRQARGL